MNGSLFFLYSAGDGSSGEPERWFERAGLLVLLVAPSGVVCLLGGAAGVNPVTSS
ncbi:MAG: hypothetical protein ACREXX_06270 [Gammaproteobacteria bacterium]